MKVLVRIAGWILFEKPITTTIPIGIKMKYYYMEHKMNIMLK